MTRAQGAPSFTVRGDGASNRIRVLVLSRNYPNNVMDVLGLWVRGQVRAAATFCDLKVVSPVPYCPPVPFLPENYTRFRRVERRRWDREIECFHPRFPSGHGLVTHTLEWLLYDVAISRTVRAIHREFPFDLIHAHFTYPDGVVAARLARRYRVPFIVTEHNLWGSWMNAYPSVYRSTMWAARRSACQIAVSEAARTRIEELAGTLTRSVVIPVPVDGAEFTLPEAPQSFDPNQILFVGAVRPIKGVDVLLHALRRLVERGRASTLTIVGEAFYSSYRREENRLKELTRQLGLIDRVRFVGKQHPPALTRTIQQSALLVLPSRMESLGLVLAESLACGTPVVATRCGGPEDIVNDRVGVLVPPDDPDALADGIERVLDHRGSYDPRALRRHALEKFGVESVGKRLRHVYEEVLGMHSTSHRIDPSTTDGRATA